MKVNRFGQAAVLSPEQMVELLGELEQPYDLVAAIAYYCAARMGEVVTLRVEDIQGQDGAEDAALVLYSLDEQG